MMSSEEKQIARGLQRYYKQNHDALHQQRSLHEEQLQQQHEDSQRNLRAEASILAAQTSAQLNVMEHDTSPEMDAKKGDK